MAQRRLHGRGVSDSPGMLPVRTHSQSYVQASSIQACSEAAAEGKKIRKYSDIFSGVEFIPFAIETSGVWREHALELETEIGLRKAAVPKVHHDSPSTAVQRGND